MSQNPQLPVLVDSIQITIPKLIKIRNLPLSPKYQKLNNIVLDTIKEGIDDIPQISLPIINPRPPLITSKKKKQIRSQFKFVENNLKKKNEIKIK